MADSNNKLLKVSFAPSPTTYQHMWRTPGSEGPAARGHRHWEERHDCSKRGIVCCVDFGKVLHM